MSTNLVTEKFLNDNFVEKNGVAPGNDNHFILSISQIKERYFVRISGNQDSKRCPVQNEVAKDVVKITGYVMQANVLTVNFTINYVDILNYNYDKIGLCWIESGIPEYTDSHDEISGNFGPGNYTGTITFHPLQTKTYNIRAYARLSVVIGENAAYSELITVTYSI